MTLKSLPKVELHLHLEGAAPPEFIRGLAREKSVDLSNVFDDEGNYKFENFTQFLQVYEAACTVLKTPDDFHRLTKAVLENSVEHGVLYTESFLSPDFCGGGDLSAWRDYSAAISDAAASMPEIEMRGVVTCIRHFGPEQAKSAAYCAVETMGDFITGFGMGGDESVGSQGDFAYSFDMAREAGLGLTTHAGEWGGPTSVKQALEDLAVSRIGHGVQAIEDPELVERLAASDIHLEVCPGSNVALGVFSDWADHPIAKLKEAGVSVSISTDDPPFFHTNLGREYDCLSETFGWEVDTFTEINQSAMRAAFCDENTREVVLKKLEISND